MARVVFRFYEELNDFLPARDRKRDLCVDFKPPVPVGHLIETLRVPHTEIELILANGRSVDLSYRPCDGDRIGVYPMFESLDVAPLVRLRPRPLRDMRFIADAHLGRLARWLRLLGFDSLFSPGWRDSDLVERALRERRVVLTRDRALLMSASVTHGCYVRPLRLADQLAYLVGRLDLCGSIRPFTRCMVCNGLVAPVVADEVWHLLPPGVRREQQQFWRCGGCGRPYWKGSHFRRLEWEVRRLCPRA
jgi:hypothetical protein